MGKHYMFAGLIAFVAAGPALAQAPAPAPPHQEHQSMAQHGSAAAASSRCCCEEMMHKMMMEMVQKHQGMGAAQPAEPKPQSEEHKH